MTSRGREGRTRRRAARWISAAIMSIVSGKDRRSSATNFSSSGAASIALFSSAFSKPPRALRMLNSRSLKPDSDWYRSARLRNTSWSSQVSSTARRCSGPMPAASHIRPTSSLKSRAGRPEQVAGSDPDAADRDRDVGPQHADPVLARAHEHPPGEDRVAQAGDLVEVAAGAVDDRPRDPVALGEGGQQTAPDGAVGAPAVGQQDHAPGRDLVDVLGGRSPDARLHRLEEDRIGRSAAAGAGPYRAQVGQPTGDPQHVESIGDHGDRGAGENP